MNIPNFLVKSADDAIGKQMWNNTFLSQRSLYKICIIVVATHYVVAN